MKFNAILESYSKWHIILKVIFICVSGHKEGSSLKDHPSKNGDFKKIINIGSLFGNLSKITQIIFNKIFFPLSVY